MAQRRGFPQRSRGSLSRKTSWSEGIASGATAGQVQAITATGAAIMGFGVQVTEDGGTLVRTRGELVVALRASDAALSGFFGAFGLAKATLTAFTAGTASLPSPIDEESWDGWFYHRYLSLSSVGVIAGANVSSQLSAIEAVVAAVRIEVDSKAMRKINVDEVFYGAVQFQEIGTATLDVSFNSRMLFKLP